MYKELLICISIIVVIISFDYMLQKYTDDAVEELTSQIDEIKTKVMNDDFDSTQIENKTDELYLKWEEYNNKFSYYIEHTELEKVETAFIVYKSYLKSKQYYDAIAESEKTKYILNHIKEKYSFSLANIF